MQELTRRHFKHGEVYEYFPDEGTGLLGPARHGHSVADSRHLMTPLMAYRRFGETFK